MSATPNSDWEPRDESVVHDQRDAYDKMRERCPVAHSDFLGWSLFRHQDIVDVLADPRTYSNASRHPAIPNGMDPPEHTRYRHLLEPYFAPERMAAFEPSCRRLAVDVLGPLLARGDMDVVAEFAEPFPLQTLCAFLGWPLGAWERLRGWNHGNQEATFSQDREAGKALAQTLMNHVGEALRAHREGRADPAEGISASLMVAQIEGKLFSDNDIASALRNWIAGEGTVAAGLGIVVHHVAAHANVQRRLREEPALLPVAINEILRADGPLVANRRITTREVKIGGRMIAAGEKLALMWIAANRDGRAFDDPGQVNIERDPDGNLLFGWGIHDCMGAPFARLQMLVGLEEFLARTSRIELDNEPPVRAAYPSNGFRTMRVCLR